MLHDCPHPPPSRTLSPCSHPNHCLTSPHFSQHLILLGPLSYLPHMPLQSANCPSCPGLVISQSITPRATSCHHNLLSLSSSSLLSVLYYCTCVMCLAPSWHRELMDGRNCAVLDGSASIRTHGKFSSISCAVSEEARAEMDHTITWCVHCGKKTRHEYESRLL